MRQLIFQTKVVIVSRRGTLRTQHRMYGRAQIVGQTNGRCRENWHNSAGRAIRNGERIAQGIGTIENVQRASCVGSAGGTREDRVLICAVKAGAAPCRLGRESVSVNARATDIVSARTIIETRATPDKEVQPR